MYSKDMGCIAAKSATLGILKPELRTEHTCIAAATAKDIPKIVSMINGEAERSHAVLVVTPEEVKSWVDNGLSFVAKTMYGEIVGHSAAKIWPESGWAEHRAVVVLPEYRGNGINSKLTAAVVQSLNEFYPGITVLSLKNENSGGRGSVEAFGFKKAPTSSVPDEILTAKEKKEYDAYILQTLARQ